MGDARAKHGDTHQGGQIFIGLTGFEVAAPLAEGKALAVTAGRSLMSD